MPGFQTLYTPHQSEAICELLDRTNKILALGTGTGKTYAALGGFQGLRTLYKEDYHFLVVCTKSAVSIWNHEIQDKTSFSHSLFTAETQPHVFEREEIHDITVCEYTVIPKAYKFLGKLFGQCKVVSVLDECHRIKNPEAALQKISYILKKNSICTWGLTATPMLNHIEDIFYLVDFFFPGALGSIDLFMRTYTEQVKKVHLGRTFYEIVKYKNLTELSERLKPYIFSRYYPMDVRFHYITTNLPEEEELRYLRAAAGNIGIDYRDFVARLPDLQLIVDNAIDVERNANYDFDYLSSKESALFNLVSDLSQRGEAVVIYSSFRKSLFRIKKYIEMNISGGAKYVITGSTPQRQRQKIEEEFSKGDILFITGAGGESVNLQISFNLIMYNIPFKVGEFIQVVGRIARMNSEYAYMNVFIIEAAGTIDTYKKMYLQMNADRIRNVIAPNPNLPECDYVPSKSLIIKLRKDLLWKTKALRQASLQANIVASSIVLPVQSLSLKDVGLI